MPGASGAKTRFALLPERDEELQSHLPAREIPS
jgi:hypothetical protein